MKKQARELKKGDRIKIADQLCSVDSIEISDIGKQGLRKVRIVVLAPNKEKLVVIRPEDYLFELK